MQGRKILPHNQLERTAAITSGTRLSITERVGWRYYQLKSTRWALLPGELRDSKNDRRPRLEIPMRDATKESSVGRH